MFPNLGSVKWALVGIASIVLFSTGWWLGDSLKQGEWDSARVKEAEAVVLAVEEARAKSVATERELTKKLNSQSKQYQVKLQEKDSEKAAAIERARVDGLRVDIQASPDKDGVSCSSSGTCRCDGETTARLSEETSRRLIELASEADKVVEQLTSCQQILEDERK